MPYWNEHDRDSTKDKLKAICKKIGYKPDKNKRPYKTLKELFRFRDLLAHGRIEEINFKEKPVKLQELGLNTVDVVKGEWESFCKVENARNAYEDVYKIADDLCTKTKNVWSVKFYFVSMAHITYDIVG